MTAVHHLRTVHRESLAADVRAELRVFIAYVLRSATIAQRTVSVGPFIPPSHS